MPAVTALKSSGLKERRLDLRDHLSIDEYALLKAIAVSNMMVKKKKKPFVFNENSPNVIFRTKRGKRTFPFGELDVSEWFFVPEVDDPRGLQQSLLASARSFSERRGIDKKFKSRIYPNGVKITRVR